MQQIDKKHLDRFLAGSISAAIIARNSASMTRSAPQTL
jgi:hypothetical protein